MRSRGLFLMLGLAVVTAIALVPWWRNHAYLRDLFDYGVMMAAAGRVAAGERPFVDFISPLQSMIYFLNCGTEKIAGASYQAMTLGGAATIVVQTWLFGWIFSRRWAVGIALLLSAALTLAMASQHLIFFYNVVGGTCVVAIAWAAALAPRWSRRDLGWHLLLGGALWVSGMNKVNFHFLALAVAIAWIVRAGVKRESSAGQVIAMLALVILFGAVLPVATELAWTGASLKAWYYNVVQIPLRGRSGDLGAALQLQSYLVPHHNYYGPLLISAMGLFGVVATTWVVGIAVRQAWQRRAMWDVFLAPLAGLLALGGGMGIMCSNYDIATVAVGVWFGLLAAIWVGFDLPARGGVVAPGLVFVGLLGVTAWSAAWNGQRSQFGHSAVARSAYVPAESAGEEYAYLRGTLLPPEMRDSLQMLAKWKRTNAPEVPAQIFYGQGLEWLERIWPAVKVPARPLWMHFGTSYALKEEEDFYHALWSGKPHRRVLIPIAYDFWPARERQLLDSYYQPVPMGVYRLYEKPYADDLAGRPFDFLNQFGGNSDPRLMTSDLQPQATSDGRTMLGATKGSGVMTLRVPAYRAGALAIVSRPAATATDSVKAHFVATVGGRELWQADVELAPGETVKSADCVVQNEGVPIEYRVEISAEMSDRIVAGWRPPSPQSTVGETRPPLPLLYPALGETTFEGDSLNALFPGDWRPEKIMGYGAHLEGDSMVVRPGGEIWIKPKGWVAELQGFVAAPAARDTAAPLPVVRACYYKNGRIDLQAQNPVRAGDGRAEFRLWSPEVDGWFVIALTGPAEASPVAIKFTQARRP